MGRPTVGRPVAKLSGVMFTMTGGSESRGPPVGVIMLAQRLIRAEAKSSATARRSTLSICRGVFIGVGLCLGFRFRRARRIDDQRQPSST